MSLSPPVYQLRVTLRRIEPPVWRRLQVLGSTTIAELHKVMQAAFGWWDYHLHDFEITGRRYGIDDGEDWDDSPLDERRAVLHGLVGEGDSFVYRYDYGDNWEHAIEVEKVLPADLAQAYPVCLDGARARPPEDCGGPGGYDRLLEVFGDPDDEEHESMLVWAGAFDPEYFDPLDFSLNLRFGPVFTASTAPVDDPALQGPLAKLRSSDPAAAKVAAAALGAVAEGHPVDAMSQWSLQRFLWDELPRQWSADRQEQRFVLDSLAVLLDLLEVPRYAQICRSDLTAQVLDAYVVGEGPGLEACADAQLLSGIRPPDLPDLTWGMFPGEREAEAYAQLSQMLELAVAAGELQPGGRAWKRRQRELVTARLDMPQPELGGTTLRRAIQAERLEHWVNGQRGPTGRKILAGILERLQSPPPAPGGEDVFPRLRWLLEQLAEGVPLTQSGNLGQKFVQGAAARFGWVMRGLPRGEDELFDLRLTREFAQRARLARRQGRKMVLTKHGENVLRDPDALWHAVAARLVPDQAFDALTGELALALLLAATELTRGELIDPIMQAATEAGFRNPATGAPPDDIDVHLSLNETLRLCAVLDLLAAGGDWNESSCRLNDAGRAMAAKALQQRAQTN